MRLPLPALLRAQVGLLLLVSSGAHAQLTARFGPRGEITEIRAGGALFFKNVSLSLVKPGWGGAIVDQRTVDPAAVQVRQGNETTVYTLTSQGSEGRIVLREIARVTPSQATLVYEITPERDVAVQTILLQGEMPADLHAGKTAYIAAANVLARGICPAEVNRDSYIIIGGAPADWIGFTTPGGSTLRAVPDNATLQFQDNRKWDVPGFGLLTMAGGPVLAAGKTVRFGMTYVADTKDKLLADARARERTDPASLPLTDDRPLRILAVAADRRRTEVFAPIELSAEIAAHYDNPFDPDQIAVDAQVRRPDGATVTVPGFFYTPMRLETVQATERLVVAGHPVFRVRYTPVMAGPHRIVLSVRDRSGVVRSAPIAFAIAAGRALGFIRTSKSSPLHFRYDSGRPYFAVGENVCWSGPRTPVAEYDAWFRGLGAAGGNWARLWLAENEKGLEWMAPPTPKPGAGSYLGLGRYAQDNAWRLDRIVRLAQQYGVQAMLCLGTYGEFNNGGFFNEGIWVSNPYNARNGGPCANPDDFWTDARARKLYKQRLRYLIARWGYSPNVFAWELWNEVPVSPKTDAWVAEMAAYLKRYDPNHHLVSTTYGAARTWRGADVDFTMKHMYGEAGNVADFTGQIDREAREALSFRKPYLLAEFGIDWQTGDGRWDPRGVGVNMHNGAWASLLSGAAGTAMLWYWDSYVHPFNLYHVLTPVRRFADTVDWAKTRFAPIPEIGLWNAPGAAESFSDLTVPATLEWGRALSNNYSVRHDGSVQGGPIASTIGSPRRAHPNELATRLTWRLELRRPTRVILRLGSVCTRAHLVVTVDGEAKVDRQLAAGPSDAGPWKSSTYLAQYNCWISNYDEEIAVEVAAGAHAVAIENTDGDWLQIRSITIPDYRSSRYPNVDALGLQSDRQILLWIHNRESTWRAAYDGKQPAAIRGLRMSVPAPRSGAWRVEWWDTFTGRVIRRESVAARSGALPLTIPDFSRDLAARLAR